MASDPSSAQGSSPTQEAAELAQTAAQYLASGRRAVAELYAWSAVETDPRTGAAWKLLAQLALDLKRPERTAAWLRRAVALQPGDAQAAALLRATETQAPAPAPAGARYLLVREWSAGFWSDVDHALGMCLLAEITGRIPLVWWGAQSRFAPAGAGNAWEQFFAPVSDAVLRDLEDPQLRVYPRKWQGRPLTAAIRRRWTGEGSRLVGLELLDRDEEIVVSDFHTGLKALLPWLPASHPLAGAALPDAYRSLARKYLRPRPDIVAEADRFAAAHFGNRPVLGVHVRGSDKVEEVSELEGVLAAYFKLLEERLAGRHEMRIFLLTDDTRVRAFYEQRYGARLLATTCTRSSSNVGVHYLKHPDRARIGVEVMVDTLLAARCTEFIGLGYSNVSLYASYLKAWPPGSCVLLEANAHDVWNAFVLLMDAPPGAE